MPNEKKKPLKWRRWNNILHRDIGYLIVALTLIYAISGVAVNHVHQWNPNYAVTHETVEVGPVDRDALGERETIEGLLRAAGQPTEYRTTFPKGEDTLRIFLEDGTVDVDLVSGRAEVEVVRARPVLHPFNFLHLNHPKKLWTWVADAYAILLALVALTGLLVRKGDAGLLGRGKWFVAAGIAVPVVFLVLYL